MTVDELIEALRALRVSEEIGSMPVAGIHPETDQSDWEVGSVEVIPEGSSGFRVPHIMLGVTRA